MKSVLWSKTDATGLAVFRMCYTLVLAYDLIQLYTFRSIIYDKVPFVEVGEFNVKLLLQFWFLALAMYIPIPFFINL
jgi:hypothetical protein